MNEIFSGFGTKIFSDGAKYYIEYDEGHFALKYVKKEISFIEAQKAQRSARDSYEVIIEIQKEESAKK